MKNLKLSTRVGSKSIIAALFLFVMGQAFAAIAPTYDYPYAWLDYSLTQNYTYATSATNGVLTEAFDLDGTTVLKYTKPVGSTGVIYFDFDSLDFSTGGSTNLDIEVWVDAGETDFANLAASSGSLPTKFACSLVSSDGTKQGSTRYFGSVKAWDPLTPRNPAPTAASGKHYNQLRIDLGSQTGLLDNNGAAVDSITYYIKYIYAIHPTNKQFSPNYAPPAEPTYAYSWLNNSLEKNYAEFVEVTNADVVRDYTDSIQGSVLMFKKAFGDISELTLGLDSLILNNNLVVGYEIYIKAEADGFTMADFDGTKNNVTTLLWVSDSTNFESSSLRQFLALNTWHFLAKETNAATYPALNLGNAGITDESRGAIDELRLQFDAQESGNTTDSITFYISFVACDHATDSLYTVDLSEPEIDPGFPTKLTGSIKTSGLTVFPNPATSVLRLNQEVSSLEVFTLDGKRVESLSTATQDLDISSYANGMYLLQAIDNTGAKVVKRFVKQ